MKMVSPPELGGRGGAFSTQSSTGNRSIPVEHYSSKLAQLAWKPCEQGVEMKLLILGGTVFVGRHLVASALAHGHKVTLFNRGQHNPDLFPEVEKLRGDRDSDLDVLKGRRWDAVVDTCGYVPRVVRRSAEALADAVGHYTFISSISAYADFSRPRLDENAPLGVLEDEAEEKVTNETYGPLKVLCERVVKTV